MNYNAFRVWRMAIIALFVSFIICVIAFGNTRTDQARQDCIHGGGNWNGVTDSCTYK